jgi:hypothetical protein
MTTNTPGMPASAPGENSYEKLMSGYSAAIEVRDKWKALFDDCYELTMPGRETFEATTGGQSRTDRIFDETAVTGVQEFASRLQAGLVPTYAQWVDLVAGSDVPEEEREEINDSLKAITKKVFDTLQNSNFNQEVHESFMDLSVSTGVLLAREGNADQPIIWSAIPLPRVALNVGPTGTIDVVYRTHKLRLWEIESLWPKAKISDDIKRKTESDPNTKFTVIEEEYRDRKKTEPTFEYKVAIKDEKYVIISTTYSGFGSSPWIPFRWSKASGEVYGRGPVLNSLPAIKVLNLTIQLILENADMSIQGMWQSDDDSVVNVDTIQLLPGTIVPRSVGSRGLEPLENPGRLDVAQLILDEMRANVRKALYNETLGPPAGTPMSATEVSERMAELARQIGSAFGRLQFELVTPVIQRVVYILKKRGEIEVPSINGREIKIVPNSPLSRAQIEQDLTDMERFAATMTNLFGPQVANLFIDQDTYAVTYADKLKLDPGVIRSKNDREALARAMQQAMQQQQQPEPGQQQQPM